MALVTLTTLRTAVRERADMEDDGNFISDAELDRYINKGIEDLYDLVLASEAGEVYVVNSPILTQVGTFASGNYASYGLPADFYKLRALHYIEGNNVYPLIPADPSNFALLSNDPPHVYAGRYTLRFLPDGTKQVFTFPEIDPTVLAMTYIPNPVLLVNPSDTFDGYNGWEDYVIVKAAIKCLTKEESDTTALQIELDGIRNDIMSHAGHMDAGYPDTIRNLHRRRWAWKYRM